MKQAYRIDKQDGSETKVTEADAIDALRSAYSDIYAVVQFLNGQQMQTSFAYYELRDEPKETLVIVVTIEAGVVESVTGIPAGYVVAIRDNDVEGSDPDDNRILEDANGDEYCETIFSPDGTCSFTEREDNEASNFRMFYRHTDCKKTPGRSWQQIHSAIVNDKCPACHLEIEPYRYEDADEDRESAEVLKHLTAEAMDKINAHVQSTGEMPELIVTGSELVTVNCSFCHEPFQSNIPVAIRPDCGLCDKTEVA